MLSFKKFILETILLIENRIEFLKSKYTEFDTSHDPHGQHKNPHDIINHFADADPHPKKANTQWVLNQYRKGNIRQEDTGRIRETLGNFERHKPRLTNKDINSYKHIADLDTAIEPHLGTVSKKQEKAQIKHEGADLVYKSPTLMVHKLKTKEAACHYGAGTKWCTAAKENNYFDHYNKQGPLYVVHHSDGSKHQFHFESEQFADEQDKMHKPKDLVSKYPELTKVPGFSDKSVHFKPEEEQHKLAHKFLDQDSPKLRQQAFDFPLLSKDHIERGLNDLSPHVRNAAISHPSVGEDHLDKAITDKDPEVRHAVLKNPKASPKHIDAGLKDSYRGLNMTAAKHPNASDQNIIDAIAHPHDQVKLEVTRRTDLKPHHITHILKHGDYHTKFKILGRDNLTSENLHTALDDKDARVRAEAIYSRSAGLEHYHRAINDPEDDVKAAALLSKHVTNADIKKYMDHPREGILRDNAYHAATFNRNNTDHENLMKVATNGESYHLEALWNNFSDPEHSHKITPEIIHASIKNSNSNEFTRKKLFRYHHDKFDDKALDAAFDTDDWELHHAMIKKLDHVQPKHLIKTMEKFHSRIPSVAVGAIAHKNANKDVFNKAFEIGDTATKVAMEHPNFGSDHIWSLLKGSDKHPPTVAARYNAISTSSKLNREHLDYALSHPDKLTQALAKLRRDNKDNPLNGE